jgi:hypothetical protein
VRRIAPALAVVLLAAVVLAGGIGPSRAQDAGSGTPDPAVACATPGATPSTMGSGSPGATPILVVEATPGVDPGEATPAVEIVCATPGAATPGS